MKNSQTIRKVMALIHKLRPGHVSLVIASRLIEAAIPNLSLVFSSIILDLLIARAPASQIMKYAIILVSSIALITFIRWGMEAFVSVNNQM